MEDKLHPVKYLWTYLTTTKWMKNYHEIISNAIVLNRTPSQESIRTVQ